ncbi:prolyl oligopeptidase family serine peptidase [Methylobacillus arboreus]|uniref:alpha/beta hydrolase n=1 Tax=Methylobacillus arboreus TaxID=755170 RepID=UPI001E4F9A63|nr:alpha/beta hydrolase-fold protein [Methylobacillus arboreus]MCB5190029.1 prolyl oligopeptidase family serine peptidase [Methylobacillus arboreus]
MERYILKLKSISPWILWGLLLCVLPAEASSLDDREAWREATLPIAQQRDIYSSSTGKTYRIFISRPADEAPVGGFPVIYVLDGNAMFYPVSMLVHGQSQRRDATGISPAVVVGIGYPTQGLLDEVQRAEDYTPPALDLADTGDRRAAKQGGADRFLSFIETELKPQLAKEFRIDSQRQALFGHSYGGLFALHVLFTQPQAFQTYIVSSPSIWWNKRYILEEQKRFEALPSAGLERLRLLLMVGSLEQQLPPGADPQSPRLAHMQQRRMVDATRELAEELQHSKPHGLNTFYRLQEGENHGTAMLTGSIRAVEFFLGNPDQPKQGAGR